MSSATLDEATVAAYLRRLNIPQVQAIALQAGATCKKASPTLSALELLVAAHVDNVAWENVDIILGRPPPALDAAACADRIVQGRGGYGFMLVSAFSALLNSLGFAVELHGAACSADPPRREDAGNHCVCVVSIGGTRWVADVGLGDGPRRPFKLDVERATAWEEDGWAYALAPRANGWRWTHDLRLGSFPGFDMDAAAEADGIFGPLFGAQHMRFWRAPDSPYLRCGALMQRRADGGELLRLRGRTLVSVTPAAGAASRQVRCVAETLDEWLLLAADVFGVELGPLPAGEARTLWDAVCADAHEDGESWVVVGGASSPS